MTLVGALADVWHCNDNPGNEKRAEATHPKIAGFASIPRNLECHG